MDSYPVENIFNGLSASCRNLLIVNLYRKLHDRPLFIKNSIELTTFEADSATCAFRLNDKMGLFYRAYDGCFRTLSMTNVATIAYIGIDDKCPQIMAPSCPAFTVENMFFELFTEPFQR
jgi:hypothetical protein